MSSSSSSCSAIDITMFLIAMISLTMSRISSRAEFAVEFGELGKVDRFDQGAEDRRLDLIVGVRSPRFDLASARAPRRSGRRRAAATLRRGGDRLRGTAGAAPEAGSGTPAARLARPQNRFQFRYASQTRRHSIRVLILPATSPIRGDSRTTRGFLVSPRPVNRCAICRNISVVR